MLLVPNQPLEHLYLANQANDSVNSYEEAAQGRSLPSA
ncbi:unnamed protein product [Haemonchus placei]|uniref:ABC transporter ATP-binding protein n=1 Tax=Haemonchus placei TaxID=6290 RepID=A0A0N4VUV2_HAEPC|nr:unnamed protein product [Haemonchus placei]